MNWYKAHNCNNSQGLIIDEDTGENIAISYKVENAGLIAAAPDLLAACQYAEDNLLAAHREGLITAPKNFMVQLNETRRLLQMAISKAEL